MNRAAKTIRVLGGLCMIVSLFFVIAPLTIIRQENYSDQNYTAWKYITQYAGDSKKQLIILGICILLPMLLALVGGVIGIVGGIRQNISGILAILVCACYILLAVKGSILWPKAKNDAQEFLNGWALYAYLASSGIAAALGVAGFFVKPRLQKKKDLVIPDVEEIRKEQIESKYTFLDEADPSNQPVSDQPIMPQNIPGDNGMMPDANIPAQPIMPQNIPGDNGMMPDANIPAQPIAPQNIPGTVAEPQDMVTEALIEEEEPIAAPYQPGVPRGVLVGIRGMYAGAEIPFRSEESIRLGRDASNDLVFTDAPRVSRHHCMITWHESKQQYGFLDRSSNGSFIHGQADCLPQNIEIMLQPGTVIDIGDEDNEFRLE